MERICYIYGLADPLSGIVRYIGKSINPQYRFKRHLRVLKPATHKEHWICSLRKLGLKPELVIIEVTTESKASEAEIFWIAEYRSRGFNLTNTTDGGEGVVGFRHTRESREKMRLSHTGKGRKHTLESRAKMSLSQLGNTKLLGYSPTIETRAKLRNSWTPERREQQSRRLKDFWFKKQA